MEVRFNFLPPYISTLEGEMTAFITAYFSNMNEWNRSIQILMTSMIYEKLKWDEFAKRGDEVKDGFSVDFFMHA